MQKICFTGARLAKRGAIVVALAAMAFSILAGCQNPVNNGPGLSGDDTGTLSLTLGGLNRTIMPTAWPEGMKVDLSFVFPAETARNFSKEDWGWDKAPDTIHLAIGAWELTATAYLGETAATGKIFSVSEVFKFDIEKGKAHTQPIILHPIKTGAGEGSFSWEISLPPSVTEAAMIVFDMESGEQVSARTSLSETNPATGSIPSLKTGTYKVAFYLEGKEAWENKTLEAALHIYQSFETKFTDPDGLLSGFSFPVPLIEEIARSWNGSRWDFEANGIKASHFEVESLNLKGIDKNTSDDEFKALEAWFNKLSVPDQQTPYDKAKLPALIDAGTLGVTSDADDFLKDVAWDKMSIEAAIKALPPLPNGTSVGDIAFNTAIEVDSASATVNVGGYIVNITFAAPVPPRTYTVTFVDGEGAEPETVLHGRNATQPAPEPTKAEHRFMGWYADAEFESIFNFRATPIEDDTNVYAKWGRLRSVMLVSAGSAHTITVLDQITGPAASAAPLTTQAVAGDIVRLGHGNAPNQTSFFESWSTVSGGVTVRGDDTFEMPDTDVVITATWGQQTFTITLEDAYGSKAMVDDGESYRTTAGKLVTLVPGARHNYEFVEWIVEAPAPGSINAITLVPGDEGKATFNMPGADTVIRAEWELIPGANLNLSLAEIKDKAESFEIPAPRFDLGESADLSIDFVDTLPSIEWRYNGTTLGAYDVSDGLSGAVTQTGYVLTLELTSEMLGEEIGEHVLTLIVDLDGTKYSRSFKVTLMK